MTGICESKYFFFSQVVIFDDGYGPWTWLFGSTYIHPDASLMLVCVSSYTKLTTARAAARLVGARTQIFLPRESTRNDSDRANTTSPIWMCVPMNPGERAKRE